MSLFTSKAIIIITCPKRLAPFLEGEVKELGFSIEETFVTGVRVMGTINDCIKLNLNLRCASQVLYSLKKFEAIDADAIYSNLIGFPWEDILPDPGYFPSPAM
jgi:putative N6-adenine-specific DNA methylase